MSKNIIVCSDGTGNTTIKGRGTNVFKLFEAVDLNGHRTDPKLKPQVAIYDDGVGTESFKPLKILGGATGFGLARNVRQLYEALVRVYDPQPCGSTTRKTASICSVSAGAHLRCAPWRT